MASVTAIAMSTLPIVETFHSVQGEGACAGCSAFFIRLAGCDVGCPWCDTKQSWPRDRHPQVAIADLVQAAVAAQPQFVVITGGEPLMHDLTALTMALKAENLRCHLETSGSYPPSGQFDWVTLSPKPFRAVDPANYHWVNELKVVIQTEADFVFAEQQSAAAPETALRLLQPEWNSPDSRDRVVDYVRQHPNWRVSLQTHKFLGVR